MKAPNKENNNLNNLNNYKDMLCYGIMYGTILAEYFKKNKVAATKQQEILQRGYERLRGLDEPTLRRTVSDKITFLVTILED